MSKTDDQLRSEIGASETRGEWGAWAVIVGLVLEVALATANSSGYGDKNVENWGAVLADSLVALGVYAEVHFGRRASHGLAELRLRSDEKVATANERAEEAAERAAKATERAAASEERAKELQKEAEAIRLAHERLKAELAWRTISQNSGNTLISILAAYNGAATIEYMTGDPEALSLAFTFADIFSKAGWNVGLVSTSIPNALIFGVFIPEDNAPQRDIVRMAFVTSGLGFSRENIVAGTMI